MQKQLEGTCSILMSSVERVFTAHRDGTYAIIVSNTHTLPAEHKCFKVIKTEQSIYECLLGFCFGIILSAPPQISANTDSFLSAQFQKRRNDG